MNQISPRIFEAILCRTALVLFEGQYSGVITPWVHFIPLKKDFSNVNDVIDKVQDDTFLRQLTDRAYHDIIDSGRYSYRSFIGNFDHLISRYVRKGGRLGLVSVVRAVQSKSGLDAPSLRSVGVGYAEATSLPVEVKAETNEKASWIMQFAIQMWRMLPTPFRQRISPLLRRCVAKVLQLRTV
jgi:hypothetical protein